MSSGFRSSGKVSKIHVSLEPPGSRLPLQLASVSRAPTLQHISDRINLISAQHNLGAPSKQVASLMMLAFEVRIILSRVLNMAESHTFA